MTAVAGIPSQPGTYYMGATGGGVWKTTDYGVRWKNVSDGYFDTPSIGAIRVALSDPDIVYVGTGSDGIRSNVITGKGVYKSADAGKTWTHIGLKNAGQIGAVEIHPEDPDLLFVAAIGQVFQQSPERGVFRTRDGGESWEKVYFHSETTGVVDLEFHPQDPLTIYASLWEAERKPWTIISGGYQGGIIKSSDGGDTWTRLGGGLPDGLIGKIDLAVSPAAPDRLVALVEAPVGKGGLYLSEDRGATFTLISSKKELLDRPFYYCNVDLDPQNANTMYVNATQFWKSTDGGQNWKSIGTPHGDNHDMWIHPTDSLLYVQANDGGANVTTNGGKTWSSILNQPTAEIYQVEVDDQYPYWLYGGQQDNSTISVPSIPPFDATRGTGSSAFWMAVGGCETGPAVPKPGDPNTVFSNCKGRFGVFNKVTGQEKQYYVGASNMYGHNPKDLRYRFQRVSPIHVSPHDPGVVYHASQFVHKTTDEGQTWETISPDLTAFKPDRQVISGAPITRDITGEEFYSAIYSLRESKVQAGVLWAGANDGPVHVTVNGGAEWKNVTPSDLPPDGRVDCVEPSPHHAAKAYIAVLRYQLGDWHPYIYRTTDYGASWTLLTTGDNGLPADFPTRVVREDPDREGLLYAGTEFGMFVSLNDGTSWQSFQQNLPVTPVTDIKVYRKDLVLSTMGRSYWILDDISPLHRLDAETDAITLLPVSDVFSWRHTERSGVPNYPGPGATINYYLPENIDGVITIRISDENGNSIRAYSSRKQRADKTNRETDMATGFRNEGRDAILKNKKGLHRLSWDLRHTGPWDKNASRSGANGPRVSPRKFTVELIADGQTQTQTFEVLHDARVLEAGTSSADLLEQEGLLLKLRDLRSEAKKLAAELESLIEKLDTQRSPKMEKSLAYLEALKSDLITRKGRYQTPMLLDQMQYLSSMLDRADQRPGMDAKLRFGELEKKFRTIARKYKEVSASLPRT